MPIRGRLLFCMALLFGAPIASADCDKPKDDKERAACIAVELRLMDDELNKTYQYRLSIMMPTKRPDWISSQRKWLKHRDEICKLQGNFSDRESWYQYVVADYFRAVCVTRLTKDRERYLKEYKFTSEESFAELRAIGALRGDQSPYEVRGSVSRREGKWYYEVQLKALEIAKKGDAVIFVGTAAKGMVAGTSAGTLVKLRPDKELPNFGIKMYTIVSNVGIALDLNNGKVYIREDGQWVHGAPETSRGLDLKLGRDYEAVVSSSVRLDNLLADRLVDVNFGEKDFAYPLPDGYLPFQYGTTAH